MRTLISVFAIGIAVALVAIVFAGTTSAGSIVGPLSVTFAAATAASGAAIAGNGANVLLVKGNHHSNHHSGHHRRYRHHRGDWWWGYPDFGWDNDYSGDYNQNCVWNGYSYTCYAPSDVY